MESCRIAQFTEPLIGGFWEVLHLMFLPLVKKEPRSRAPGHIQWKLSWWDPREHTSYPESHKICCELLLFRCMFGIYFNRWSLEQHHILFSSGSWDTTGNNLSCVATNVGWNLAPSYQGWTCLSIAPTVPPASWAGWIKASQETASWPVSGQGRN